MQLEGSTCSGLELDSLKMSSTFVQKRAEAIIEISAAVIIPSLIPCDTALEHGWRRDTRDKQQCPRNDALDGIAAHSWKLGYIESNSCDLWRNRRKDMWPSIGERNAHGLIGESLATHWCHVRCRHLAFKTPLRHFVID